MSLGGDVIDVQTGEVRSGRKGCILVSRAIGSCVAVGIFDRTSGCSGLAHVMLPGSSGGREPRLRYAQDAVAEMTLQMELLACNPGDCTVVLAGGANVLKDPEDTLCRAVVESVLESVRFHGLRVEAESLRGTERRQVRLCSRLGHFYCAVGDRPESLLWSWTQKAITDPQPQT